MTDINLNIVNCTFRFQCDKKWEVLTLTNDASVRHCAQCNKGVYLSKTVEEINKNILRGVCMAIPLDIDPSTMDESCSGHIVGQIDSPYDIET